MLKLATIVRGKSPLKSPLRSQVVAIRVQRRTIWASPTLLKKKAKEPVQEGSEVDVAAVLKTLETQFKASIGQFGERAAQIKLGKADTDKLGQVSVGLGSGKEAALRTLCNMQVKNNHKLIVMTVFDPKHTKRIQASLLEHLNLTAQEDARNPQVLSVAVPKSGAEAQAEVARQLKKEHDHVRNSPSKQSLTALRESALKQIKRGGLGADELKRHSAVVDKLFKKYADSLQAELKAVS